jgi:hypothetical protein
MYNKHLKRLYACGLVLSAFSLVLIAGVFEKYFEHFFIPQDFGLLILGIGQFMLTPELYFSAKEREKQYGTMSWTERSNYGYSILIGIICIGCFFLLLNRN